MTDNPDTYTCKCCRQERSRITDGAPKIMPKGSAARTGCPPCWRRAQEFGAEARDFSVEHNFKKAGTSSQAAQKAAKAAKPNDTHRTIYRSLQQRPMTADEVAEVTGIKLLTVRPRMSDLRNPKDQDKNPIAPFAVATGEQRAPVGGEPADVVRVTTPEERAAWTVEGGFPEQRRAA